MQKLLNRQNFFLPGKSLVQFNLHFKNLLSSSSNSNKKNVVLTTELILVYQKPWNVNSANVKKVV